MSNLIVTIISIVLIAVAALMGIFYGGAAFENGQINAIADSIINESNQILIAERLWAVNNNQPDISGMLNPSVTNGVTFLQLPTAYNIGGSGIGALYDSKLLGTWPTLAGTIGGPSYTLPGSFPGAGPAPHGTSTLGNTADENGCYSFNGYVGSTDREVIAYRGSNYVYYQFGINLAQAAGLCGLSSGSFSSSTTDTSQANHPIVLIAKAVNAKLNKIPSNATTTLMPYLGLPEPPAGSTYLSYGLFADANGVFQTNYCYLSSLNLAIIVCVFGPS